jgi:hypothetical protein
MSAQSIAITAYENALIYQPNEFFVVLGVIVICLIYFLLKGILTLIQLKDGVRRKKSFADNLLYKTFYNFNKTIDGIISKIKKEFLIDP